MTIPTSTSAQSTRRRWSTSGLKGYDESLGATPSFVFVPPLLIGSPRLPYHCNQPPEKQIPDSNERLTNSHLSRTLNRPAILGRDPIASTIQDEPSRRSPIISVLVYLNSLISPLSTFIAMPRNAGSSIAEHFGNLQRGCRCLCILVRTQSRRQA